MMLVGKEFVAGREMKLELEKLVADVLNSTSSPPFEEIDKTMARLQSWPELTGSASPEAHDYAAGLREDKPMTMVECVAKAIYDNAEDDLGNGWRAERELQLKVARAAIAAMREPTNHMIGAVLDSHDKAPRTTRVIDDWQTAIDAALKE